MTWTLPGVVDMGAFYCVVVWSSLITSGNFGELVSRRSVGGPEPASSTAC